MSSFTKEALVIGHAFPFAVQAVLALRSGHHTLLLMSAFARSTEVSVIRAMSDVDPGQDRDRE